MAPPISEADAEKQSSKDSVIPGSSVYIQQGSKVPNTGDMPVLTSMFSTTSPQSIDSTTEKGNESQKSQGKRRRIANKKYDDGILSAEEEDFVNTNSQSAAKIMRKSSEEVGNQSIKQQQQQQQQQPQVGLVSGSVTEAPSTKVPKSSGSSVSNQVFVRDPLSTSRSRITIALSAEKISRILMRALQVFGPLSATQCTQLINKKRKQNVEEIPLKTVSAVLELLAATPVVNRITDQEKDSEEMYVWHESCNTCLNQSLGEESLREPLRVSTALSEVVRGKKAVEDTKQRIQLIKAELKKAPEENSVRSLQNFLEGILITRRELFDPSLHPKHTDLIYRRACRVARLPVETRLSEATSMFDGNQLVESCNQTSKQCYEFEEHLPFDVSQYNINAHYDMGCSQHKSSSSSSSSSLTLKTEKRPYNKREKSDDTDPKNKKPVTPSAYSAWCREGMLVRHKSGRDGHIVRLKGPWIEVRFVGAKNSCATRVSDLQPAGMKHDEAS